MTATNKESAFPSSGNSTPAAVDRYKEGGSAASTTNSGDLLAEVMASMGKGDHQDDHHANAGNNNSTNQDFMDTLMSDSPLFASSSSLDLDLSLRKFVLNQQQQGSGAVSGGGGSGGIKKSSSMMVVGSNNSSGASSMLKQYQRNGSDHSVPTVSPKTSRTAILTGGAAGRLGKLFSPTPPGDTDNGSSPQSPSPLSPSANIKIPKRINSISGKSFPTPPPRQSTLTLATPRSNSTTPLPSSTPTSTTTSSSKTEPTTPVSHFGPPISRQLSVDMGRSRSAAPPGSNRAPRRPALKNSGSKTSLASSVGPHTPRSSSLVPIGSSQPGTPTTPTGTGTTNPFSLLKSFTSHATTTASSSSASNTATTSTAKVSSDLRLSLDSSENEKKGQDVPEPASPALSYPSASETGSIVDDASSSRRSSVASVADTGVNELRMGPVLTKKMATPSVTAAPVVTGGVSAAELKENRRRSMMWGSGSGVTSPNLSRSNSVMGTVHMDNSSSSGGAPPPPISRNKSNRASFIFPTMSPLSLSFTRSNAQGDVEEDTPKPSDSNNVFLSRRKSASMGSLRRGSRANSTKSASSSIEGDDVVNGGGSDSGVAGVRGVSPPPPMPPLPLPGTGFRKQNPSGVTASTPTSATPAPGPVLSVWDQIDLELAEKERNSFLGRFKIAAKNAMSQVVPSTTNPN